MKTILILGGIGLALVLVVGRIVYLLLREEPWEGCWLKRPGHHGYRRGKKRQN